MTYQEKLRDIRWQERRLEIIERDKSTCQECFGPYKDLHVHHKYYKRNAEPWEYKDDALVTLCANCHRQIHYYLKDYDKEFSERFSKVFFGADWEKHLPFRFIL